MSPLRKRPDAVVKEMWMGICIWGIAAGLVAVCFVKDRIHFTAGLFAGCLLAAAGVWHMWTVLDRALDLGEGAQRYVTVRSLARYGVFVLVFVVLAVTRAADPLAAFLGLMGMKVAAYLQPLLHKMRRRRR